MKKNLNPVRVALIIARICIFGLSVNLIYNETGWATSIAILLIYLLSEADLGARVEAVRGMRKLERDLGALDKDQKEMRDKLIRQVEEMKAMLYRRTS